MRMKPTLRNKRVLRDRSGSALLLTLLILFASVGMIAVVQQALFSRQIEQRILENEGELRAALLLALQESMRAWSEDVDRAVDHPGEPWALPRSERADNGTTLQFQLSCAQDRFNVNNLTLPTSDLLPRGPWDMAEVLLARREEPPKAEILRALRDDIAERAPVFADPSELGEFFDGPEFIALPRPATRPVPLNLNTVRPEVLSAVLGSSFDGWVDRILRARETEPIRSAEAMTRDLPPPVLALLTSLLDTRSDVVEFRAEARRDHTRKTLQALLRRDAEGTVEVLSCRW